MQTDITQLPAAPDLAERVYRSLLDAISAGTLAPGQRLTQEELAERLAVSRQPVIQALKLLRKDGFVEEAPPCGTAGRTRGLQVAPLEPTFVAHLYEVRGALDALAARLAAQRRTALDPGLLERGRAAARRGDGQALLEADLAFHGAIYRATGNPLIEQSAALHWAHIRRVMAAVLQSRPAHQIVWDEHEAMARAIARGDADRASTLMLEHAGHASQRLAAGLGNAQVAAGGAPARLRGARPPR
jgi:DNA-binding GntR family transcriptional regulator